MSRSRCSSCSRIVIENGRPEGPRATRHAGGPSDPPDHDLTKKAGAVSEAADAEVFGERLTEVGKRLAGSEIDALPDARAGHEQRHIFPRMIRARRRRVIAVIGGDDEKIVITQARQQAGQTSIE